MSQRFLIVFSFLTEPAGDAQEQMVVMTLGGESNRRTNARDVLNVY